MKNCSDYVVGLFIICPLMFNQTLYADTDREINQRVAGLGFKLDLSYMYHEHYHKLNWRINVVFGLACIVCEPRSICCC